MTLWIDPPAWPAHGRLWSHLVSDRSYAELHEFASAQGVPRRAFEGDHYDVPQDRYADLVSAGARPVSGGDLVRILRSSGLRIQKRTHERVVASRSDVPWLPPGTRLDVIASRQPRPPSATVQVRLAVQRGDDLLVVRDRDGRADLPTETVLADGPQAALDVLRRRVLGRDVHADAPLLGYVRYVVPDAAAPPGQTGQTVQTGQTGHPAYPWPRPNACFAVFAEPSSVVTGSWGPAPHDGVGSWESARDVWPPGEAPDWWPLLYPEGSS